MDISYAHAGVVDDYAAAAAFLQDDEMVENGQCRIAGVLSRLMSPISSFSERAFSPAGFRRPRQMFQGRTESG